MQEIHSSKKKKKKEEEWKFLRESKQKQAKKTSQEEEDKKGTGQKRRRNIYVSLPSRLVAQLTEVVVNQVNNITKRILTSRRNWEESRSERVSGRFGKYQMFLSS